MNYMYVVKIKESNVRFLRKEQTCVGGEVNFSAARPWEGFVSIRLALGLHCSALLGLSRQIDQTSQGFPLSSLWGKRWIFLAVGGPHGLTPPVRVQASMSERLSGRDDPTHGRIPNQEPLSRTGTVSLSSHQATQAGRSWTRGLIELFWILPQAGWSWIVKSRVLVKDCLLLQI